MSYKENSVLNRCGTAEWLKIFVITDDSQCVVYCLELTLLIYGQRGNSVCKRCGSVE